MSKTKYLKKIPLELTAYTGLGIAAWAIFSMITTRYFAIFPAFILAFYLYIRHKTRKRAAKIQTYFEGDETA